MKIVKNINTLMHLYQMFVQWMTPLINKTTKTFGRNKYKMTKKCKHSGLKLLSLKYIH